MKPSHVIAVLLSVVFASVLLAQTGPSAEVLLKAAVNREVVDRDFVGAIEQDRDIAAKFAANAPVAAQALLRLGDLYERMGSAEAQPTYQRVVAEYPSSGAAAAAARARLSAIQQAAAGPFREQSLDKYLGQTSDATGSADGRWLAYQKPIPGKFNMIFGHQRPIYGYYLLDLSTGKERPLLDPDTAGSTFRIPVFSADSARAAIVAGRGERGRDLQVSTLARGESRSLESCGNPSLAKYEWSPNGQFLSYIADTGSGPRGGGGRGGAGPYAICVFDAATGQARSIGPASFKPGSWPETAWSPDSQRLAFLVDGADGALDLRIASVATGEGRTLRLPPPPSGARVFVGLGSRSWTQKDEVLFRHEISGVGTDYFLIPAAGGEARKICEGRGPSGGDGCQELVLGGQYQIARQNVANGGRLALRSTADGKETPYTIGSGVEQTVLGGSSPDGQLLLFRSNRDGKWGLYATPADRIPTKDPVLVTPLDWPDSIVGGWWTRSGIVLHFDNSQTNISRIDLDPATGRTLGPANRLTQDTPRNRSAIVSPNGRFIAYVTTGGTKTGLAVMDASGANERIALERRSGQPRLDILGWRSNDDVLCTEGGATAGQSLPLVAVNIRTGATTPIPSGITGYVMARFAPSTQEIFYVAARTNRLRALSLTSMATRDVLTFAEGWRDFVVAPDGRVVYSRLTPGDFSADQLRPGELHVVAPNGEDRVLAKIPDMYGVFDVVTPLSVSPDGRLLYRDAENRLLVLNLATLESQTVDLPTLTGSVVASWSPDGRYILTETTTERHTWRAIDGVTYDVVTKRR